MADSTNKPKKPLSRQVQLKSQPKEVREILNVNWTQIDLPPDQELELIEATLNHFKKGEIDADDAKKALIRRKGETPVAFPYQIDRKIVDKLKPLELTFFERRAVLLYCISGDLMWSLKTAGYKRPTLIRAGFLQKKAVRQAMEIIDEHLTSASIADAKEVREFWTQTMYDEKISLTNRIKCSDLLAKSHGMFIEKIQLERHETKQIDVSIQFAHLPPGALGRSLGLDDHQKIIDAEPASPKTDD